MIDLSIAAEFAAAGLRVTLGVLSAEISPGPSGAALLADMKEAENARIAEFQSSRPADIAAVAETRRAYKALGKDPSRYRPSAEALMRRLALGKGLYRINNAVDVINLVSVRTGFSIGGYDAGLIQPPVVFRRAAEGETYEAIGRGAINLEGLPVFCDETGPFGSPTSDSTRTMISEHTHKIFMAIIAFGDAAPLKAAVDGTVTALRDHCAARDIELATIGDAL